MQNNSSDADAKGKTLNEGSSKPDVPKGDKKKWVANYHAIFDQATDAIFVTDVEGNFIDVNESGCTMFGYSKSELLQLNIRKLIEPEQLLKRPIALTELVEGQKILSERRMVTKQGEVLEVHANVKKINDDAILAIVRDVTEMKEAQKMMALSEAQFRGAFEQSANGMTLVSPKGKFIKVNIELCKMLGYTEDELLSFSIADVTHPDDNKRDEHFLKEALSGVTDVHRIEKRYVHKNGAIVWVKLNVALIKDNEAKPLFFVSHIEDITAKKQSEEALIQSEANLKSIFESTQITYLRLDENFKVVTFNEHFLNSYEEQTGFRVYVGADFTDMMLPDKKEAAVNIFHLVLSKCSPITYESSYTNKQKLKHLNITISPVINHEKAIGLCISSYDITNVKNMEFEKQTIISDLVKRNKDLEEFTHILSHKVRSNVATLMGLSNVLMNYETNEHENKEIVNGISESAQGLDEIIRSLNDILRTKVK